MSEDLDLLKLMDLGNNHITYIKKSDMTRMLSDLADYYDTLANYNKEREQCKEILDKMFSAPSGSFN